ncbi:MAG: hypothetical protein JW833_17800 [Prolixibacteraceae bacterium]|nr:hypothetical protein [Prolixibacteraceae bacterium]
MSGTSLAIKIGTLVIGAGIFLVMLKKIKGLKKFGWASLFYILVISMLLALPTFLLFFNQEISEISLLFIAQSIIIILGVLHVVLAQKLLPFYSTQVFGMQIVFIICTLLFAYFFTNLSFTFFVESSAEFVWILSLLWFLIPVLLNQTVTKLLEVPHKEFKKWQYPVGSAYDDPTDEEMENPVVISFVFKKDSEDSDLTTFRAKAPVGMSLGKLFYFFINDYNSRHPEGLITYKDENNEPGKWVFFKVKSKLFRLKEALDPDESIYNSNIKENDVLICKRTGINQQ